MDEYKPSSIVVSLCKKLNAIPIAESDRLKTDGVLVIVVADGRKLTFSKDDITRTLTEPDPVSPETASVDTLEVAAPAVTMKAGGRKKKE
jgi:hypothetical protein